MLGPRMHNPKYALCKKASTLNEEFTFTELQGLRMDEYQLYINWRLLSILFSMNNDKMISINNSDPN